MRAEPPTSRSSSGRATRALDLTALVLSAPAWIPLLGVLAAATALTSGRPITFRQERLGVDGQPFTLIKFRTMLPGENPLIPDADRITPFGKFLRRSSLDELPQLLNVWRGEMSLVGPRPMLPAHGDRLNDRQKGRFSTRPGMTGLAQVSGRNGLLWSQRIDLDLEWSKNPSVRQYLSILRRTGRVVVSGDGIDGHDASDPILLTSSEVSDDVDTSIPQLPKAA